MPSKNLHVQLFASLPVLIPKILKSKMDSKMKSTGKITAMKKVGAHSRFLEK